MKVSVVICTYSLARYEVFIEAVESVLNQIYDAIELVLVIDGNEDLFKRIKQNYDHLPEVIIDNNAENRGISYSRTKGAKLASGDIVAFIDDDGVAEPDWISTLVNTYTETDAIAVGGYVAPDWVTEKPDFFPDEFYWLVGCTERGFANDGDQVRNGYGSNVSYIRDAFLEVGGYDPNTGRKGDRHIQAHEAPVGIRLIERYGKGIIYNEDAVVHHKLFDYRGKFCWLVFRSFWQGYSKRIMSILYDDPFGNETGFLKQIFFRSIPERLKTAIRDRSIAEIKQALAILLFTGAVGLGYCYAIIQRPNLLEEDAE